MSSLKHHPRPDFSREKWVSLNGTWDFQYDDDNIGLKECWFDRQKLERQIQVPFVYQCRASGINEKEIHEFLWYQRKVRIPDDFSGDIFLCFGAVDFCTQIWIDGVYVGEHRGGYTPFSFNISDYVTGSSFNMVVRVEDRVDCAQPRGKQYWGEHGNRCWYTPSSGIWQEVYLEERPKLYFDSIHCEPDIDNGMVSINYKMNMDPGDGSSCSFEILRDGVSKKKVITEICSKEGSLGIKIDEEDSVDETHFWTPDNPVLYDVSAVLDSGDSVRTYFGMRKISVSNGRVLLNNRFFYQRLILDQGYWEDTLLTPPSDEDIKKDVQLIKAMGFNGVRMHQKIEDPRFYYWADRLGLVVWGELPSAYRYCNEECMNLFSEMNSFIDRDFNHPSIICWVPLNESWGVRNIYSDNSQQNFALSMYYFIRALDGSRLCDTNDGWEQVTSDLSGIHDYVHDGEAFSKKWAVIERTLESSIDSRMIYSKGFKHTGQPILITEFGGIAFSSDFSDENWGYSGGEPNEESFIRRFSGLIKAVVRNSELSGFCYTQFADVMQEVNGLLKADRTPKLSLETIRAVITQV